MTKAIDNYKKYCKSYNKSIKWLNSYKSDYLYDINILIDKYFSNHNIENGSYRSAIGNDIGVIEISLIGKISYDILYEMAKTLDFNIIYYNGDTFHLEVKEDDIHD